MIKPRQSRFRLQIWSKPVHHLSVLQEMDLHNACSAQSSGEVAQQRGTDEDYADGI